jgi:hexosaminidase
MPFTQYGFVQDIQENKAASMKIKLEGNWQDLQSGIDSLSQDLGLELSPDGLPVRVEQRSGGIEVRLPGGRGSIFFEERNHFFRAFGLFIESATTGDDFELKETPQFDTLGVMVDMSRNAVLTVNSMQVLLRRMALMGINSLMLYIEDTYTIESEPYFGYMRGRYSRQELQACVEYAAAFGIEIIPCIQTLAHLEQFLKWTARGRDLIDTNGVLLVGSDETYRLIEKMIESISATFDSKRIHIGMDEALGVGRGRYLDRYGHRDRFDILSSHLAKVLEITERYGLKPMIWSDMYFRIASKTHDYYDLEAVIPEQVKQALPSGVQLVYWDYYNEDEAFYCEYIKRHKELNEQVVFAGGAWSWNGIGVSYGKVFSSTHAALNSCKALGVKQVILTLWGDDGSESNIFSTLLALQLYAEHGYVGELDLEKLKRRVQFCTGTSFDAFMDLKYLDETPGTLPDNREFESPANPSKFLLWQDVLIGLFDKHIEGLDLPAHYDRLEEKLGRHKNEHPEWAGLFDVPQKLCAVLQKKSNLGLLIKDAYDRGDRAALERIAGRDIPDLIDRVQALRSAHRVQWFSTYKAFGWEVLDIRYGGVLARLDSAAIRLNDYVHGRVECIEELEVERLSFDGKTRPQADVSVGFCNQYTRIATPGLFSLVWPPI